MTTNAIEDLGAQILEVFEQHKQPLTCQDIVNSLAAKSGVERAALQAACVPALDMGVQFGYLHNCDKYYYSINMAKEVIDAVDGGVCPEDPYSDAMDEYLDNYKYRCRTEAANSDSSLEQQDSEVKFEEDDSVDSSEAEEFEKLKDEC